MRAFLFISVTCDQTCVIKGDYSDDRYLLTGRKPHITGKTETCGHSAEMQCSDSLCIWVAEFRDKGYKEYL